MAENLLHHRTCPICEAMCGIVVERRDGQVLSIKPDHDDVLSRGHICPKAVALKDIHEDPDRLRRPVRRRADGWEEVSWPEAYDEIERRIGEVRARHGNDAVAIYAGNPVVHNLGAMLGIGDFIRAVRTRNLYSATSVDQLPHMMTTPWASTRAILSCTTWARCSASATSSARCAPAISTRPRASTSCRT